MAAPVACRPLRVLQLGSPEGLYGAERWILALISHLDRSRVETLVGTIADRPALEPPLLARASTLGFETVRVEAHGRLNWAAVTQLRRVLIEHRVDILHTHFYKTDLIGLLAARGTRCKLVTTPHGWSVRAGLALRAYEALDRQVFRFFDAVVPLSPQLHDELAGRAGPGLQLIPNGVDIADIDAQSQLSPEAEEWRAAGDFVVGYVGQLISRKGIDVLLRAFAAAQLPRGRLAIVGEGEQRQALEATARELRIADRTHFLGYREDRIGLMRGFDVFALPSRLEGIPRCLMEAMAAGTPVVSSDIPGSRELIEHDRTGLLFPMDDVRQLTHSLQTLADNAVLAGRLKTAARERVVADYSAGAMAAAYTSLYDRLQERP